MDRTVAVPGGSGKLGRAMVAALIQEGWTMINFDRVPCRTVGFIRSDLGARFQNPPAYGPLDENVQVEGIGSLCSTEQARRLLDWANGKMTCRRSPVAAAPERHEPRRDETRPRLDRPGRWRSDRLRPSQGGHLATECTGSYTNHGSFDEEDNGDVPGWWSSIGGRCTVARSGRSGAHRGLCWVWRCADPAAYRGPRPTHSHP